MSLAGNVPAANPPIRVLHLEDTPRDAALIKDLLEADGLLCDIVWVDGRERFESALEAGAFDVILCDFNLPDYDGMTALKRATEVRPETPVIIASGSLSEVEAVECLHLGAADYVLKQRVERLPSAVRRALDQARLREQHQASERALKESEERFRQLAEHSADGFWFIGLSPERVLYVSPAVTRMFGRPAERFYEHAHLWIDCIHPEDRSGVVQAWEACRLDRSTRYDQEYRVVRPDGSVIVVSDSGTPILDDAGEVIRYGGIVRDITERRRVAEALRETEERLGLAQQAADVGVWDWNRRSGEVQWTPGLARLYGLEPGAVHTYQDWYQRMHRDDIARVEAARDAAIAEHRSFELEFRVLHASGKVRWMLTKGSAVYDDAGTAVRVLGVHIDITERKQLEAQFLGAQKMESVGRLAGGIAHDFNNLLTVINSTAELAAMELRQDDPLRQDLTEIRDAGLRGAALTHQLLAFSRTQVLQPRVVKLTTLIEGLQPLLRRLIGEDIQVPVALAEDLANVSVDPSQMEQVILNLSVNARDAMPDGGTLTIEARNVELDEGDSSMRPTVQPGRYVMLAVSDTGIGMSEATRQRIFEPFFTTKPLGKGTGLGLAMVYGIVKQSGGSIWVYSEVGKGTTFKIYLPVAGAAGEQVPTPTPTRPEARGSETILLVEDEEGIRRLAKRVLERAGYAVLVAANGGEALRSLEGHDGPLDLLLTDVVMPGMSGPDLAERLKASHANTKVLYMSGYTDEAIVHHGVLDEDVHLIGKPYSVADLTHKVREVLDS